MEILRQIPDLNDNISRAPKNTIVAFHKFVFGIEGDRGNRSRLRNFKGFDFAEDSTEFQNKVIESTRALTLGDLTAICNLLRLEYTGTAEEVARRITQSLTNLELLIQIPESEEEEVDRDEESEAEGEVTMIRAAEPRFSLSFRDIEDTIRTFNGSDGYPIETWLSDFEDNAKLLKWSELQKLLFAKKCLSGLAKLFMQGEKGISSWKILRSRLLNEFSSRINSAQLHQMLFRRKMKREESVQEYFLIMKELASRGSIETDSLIQYIVDGIPDEASRKTFLYDAHDLSELKRKLSIYEKVKVKMQHPVIGSSSNKIEPTGKQNFKNKVSTAMQGTTNVVLRCYNCGESGHISSACPKPKRSKGSCYICGRMDHKKYACPQRNEKNLSTSTPDVNATTHLVESEQIIPCYEVKVILDIGEFTAVLDTGSPVSMIDINCLPMHVNLAPCVNSVRFDGANESKIMILGRLKQNGKLGNDDIQVNFYVVPSSTMKCKCLLGRDFIVYNNLEAHFSNEVNISKKVSTNDFDCAVNEILHVDVSETIDNLPKININEKVSCETQQEIRSIVNDSYVKPDRPETPITDLEMELVVKPNHQPFYFNPRRLSYNEKEAVSRIINDLLNRGIIRPSSSQYSSPIVLVRKKSGDFRMAVDYRELNKLTLRDNFPIPLIDDQIDSLQGKVYFTKLDLKDAFHHIKLKESSVLYTSFSTFMGQYEYVRMPFGLSNGPSFFMRFINKVFRPLLDKNKILIYLDDLLIATETIEENLKILKEVLSIMVQNCLDLKFEKCAFLFTEINYLGYRINSEGIKPNPENIAAVVNYPTPRNYKELESFLGLISYFRRFIQNFATISKPLYDLKKSKEEFVWNENALKCCNVLKEALVTEPVLSIYCPTAETQLHCDASSHGYGSVLMQKQADGKFHPICYFSKRTSKAESQYHSFELECLAIVYSLERFRIYLQGMPFKLITDCNSLKLALEKKDINPRILRWSLILRNYNYTTEHRSAERMRHADALSREFNVMVITENTFEKNLEILQGADPEICEIRSKLEQNEDKVFELNNGLVYRKCKGRLQFYVPKSMENNVIRTCHEEIAHQGVNKTIEYLSRTYWLPKMQHKVQEYISNCLKCITYATVSNKTEGRLHCIDKGNIPFQCLHIDHFGPLERTKHKQKYIFEIIDSFTKFVKFYPVTSTNADEVIRHMKNYFSVYSKPKRIVSDRGSAFTSDKFKTFLSDNRIEHVLIATATPHANGQIERINRSLTPMLAKLSKTTSSWNDILTDVEFAFNNSVNRSVGDTPARLLFGTQQIGRINDDLRLILDEQIAEERDVNRLRKNAIEKLELSNVYNKEYYDKKHKAPTLYKLGDYVMIKNTAITPGVNNKLLPKFRGPYIVKQVLDKDRYVISDPVGHQVVQIPYEGICSPENMKPWLNTE